MCIALIGGMERLERHYKKEAKRCGVELKVFNIHKAGIHSKIRRDKYVSRLHPKSN